MSPAGPADPSPGAASTAPAILITKEADLRAAAERLLVHADRIALDIESNCLFKYKATLCTMQLAGLGGRGGGGGGGETNKVKEVIVVDTIALPLTPLAELLGPKGPRKIVHDVAFDARILAEAGLVLANVYDTSIAARMLGRTATGLASLLGSELGIAMDKKLQHHDWTERPIRASQLRYLADDVVHLEALAEKLWAEVDERGIADEIEEETRYRLAQAITATSTIDPRPPWVRLKGIDRVPPEELPILRRLAQLREDKARKLDVPPYKVIGPDVLFAIARARPSTMADLDKIKGALGGQRARSLAGAMLDAVKQGLADQGHVPDEERAMLERPRVPSAIAKARRQREQRLTSWRKKEAKLRGVDEQVVLPGHCLQDLADLDDDATLDQIAQVPGIGAFRVARNGEALALALAAPPPPSPSPIPLPPSSPDVEQPEGQGETVEPPTTQAEEET